MEYIPGSHKLDQIPHRDTFAKHNLLTRGQEVMVEVDLPSGGSSPCVSARCRCTPCASFTAPRRTRRTTGASVSPSAISRLTWRSSPARIVPPRARPGSPSPFHGRAAAEPRSRRRIRGISPHHHRTERLDPLLRHGRRQLQRAEGAGPTRLNRRHAGPGEAPSPLRLVKPHHQPTRAASALGG
jgi:hypothetical protein